MTFELLAKNIEAIHGCLAAATRSVYAPYTVRLRAVYEALSGVITTKPRSDLVFAGRL